MKLFSTSVNPVLALVSLALLGTPCLMADAGARPPDIVIIMADDMGFSDIGCYGGEIKTPSLDQLAAQGLRFTQFYNTGRCCPTRASLLTGLYPHQAGVGHMVNDRGLPGYQGHLNRQCVTIAEALKPAGYTTGLSGKWHVTPFDYVTREAPHRATWPLQRGFDFFEGTLSGGGNFFYPKGYMHGNEFIEPGKDFYYTDVISDAAVNFIARAATREQPFFLYVAYTAPHWPLHALPEDIEAHRDLFTIGRDKVRENRLRRMVEMGIIDRQWVLSKRDHRVKAWEDAEYHAWRARCMAVYAAQIYCMDQGIGRIVAALKQGNRIENTLVLFLADNGGCAEVIKRPWIERFAAPGQSTDRFGTRPEILPGDRDTFASYGIGWANVSNTPFRWYKHYVHEGGIATPLIAHWPKGIAASLRGRLAHDPGHLVDLMATCVDLARADYPKRFKGQDITPMQGISLRSAFEGRPLQRSRPLFWEHEGNRAMRDGTWKLVAKGAKGPWELYDLEADRTETRDLAEAQPDRVKRMAAQWEAWARAAKVKPWPWKN